MRFAVLIVCAGVTLSARAGQPPSPLDEPMQGPVRVTDVTRRPPCELWTALEQLARQAQVRIGFEQTPDCWSAPWSGWPGGNSLSLEGLTPRQAFDRLLSHRPDYRWAEIDGVVVIRPVPAWAPEGSVLNGPVAAFAVVDESSALHPACDLPVSQAVAVPRAHRPAALEQFPAARRPSGDRANRRPDIAKVRRRYAAPGPERRDAAVRRHLGSLLLRARRPPA